MISRNSQNSPTYFCSAHFAQMRAFTSEVQAFEIESGIACFDERFPPTARFYSVLPIISFQFFPDENATGIYFESCSNIRGKFTSLPISVLNRTQLGHSNNLVGSYFESYSNISGNFTTIYDGAGFRPVRQTKLHRLSIIDG